MIVYHVFINAIEDYLVRREPHRKAHLERLVALRARGLCLGGGPAPDGRTADVFYRTQGEPQDVAGLGPRRPRRANPGEQPGDLTRLIEEDPYFTGGVWTTYRPRTFSEFLEPWELAPVVVDGSRRVTIVEGETPDVEMASFALIEARGAGRMVFGGFFPGGQTLALMRAAEPDEALTPLRETGLWKSETLTGRPLLHVL